MGAGWAGICCPAPKEESLDPLLLSDEVAISARDHSLGLGAGTALVESSPERSLDAGVTVRSGSEPLSSSGAVWGGAPLELGPGMWGIILQSLESLTSGSGTSRSESLLLPVSSR